MYDKYILLCSSQDEFLKFEAIYSLNSKNSNINMFKANNSYLCVTYHPIKFGPGILSFGKYLALQCKARRTVRSTKNIF